MKILEALIASIEEDVPVREVVISTHSTVVCSKRCGMSSTILSMKPHGEEFIREAGQLHLKTAMELAKYALSENPLEASIGIAAINSIIEIDLKQFFALDAAAVIVELALSKNITIVGHFPFIPRVKEVAQNCWVLEQNPARGEHIPERAGEFIPQSDVVAITGSALINHTLENLLTLCPKDAKVMVIGPSTPLSSILFKFNIDIISGALVENEAAVLRSVSQGAIFRQMQGIKRLVMVKPELMSFIERL